MKILLVMRLRGALMADACFRHETTNKLTTEKETVSFKNASVCVASSSLHELSDQVQTEISTLDET